MRFLRLVAVLLSLSLEIRVKAAPRQEPVDCVLTSEKLCSLFAFSPTSLQLGKNQLKLASGTILYRDKQKKWNFLAGALRVQSIHTFAIATRIGEVKVGPGVTWLKWNQNQLWVYSIEGSSQLILTSSLIKDNLVPEGFYNWYGFIDKNGESTQGVPRRITVNQANAFLPGFRGSPDAIKTGKWENRSIAMASDFYHEVAQNMEDNYVARLRENEQRIENKKKLDQSIRRLFRQKYFSPVEFPSDGVETDN